MLIANTVLAIIISKLKTTIPATNTSRIPCHHQIICKTKLKKLESNNNKNGSVNV